MLAQDERLTRRVGAIALAVIFAAVAFFVLLWSKIEWGSHVRVAVYFHHTGGLREGAPFVVAGHTIGRVESIAPSPRGADTPLHGEDGVKVTVAIDTARARELKHGADVFVSSRGALSDRYLEIGPTPETGEPLADGQPILGRDPPTLDRVLQRTWDNLTAFRMFLDDLRPEARELRARLVELGITVGTLPIDGAAPFGAELDALIAEARRTYGGSLGGRAGIDHIRTIIDHARAVAVQARASLDILRARATTLSTAAGVANQRISGKGTQVLAKLELAIDRARAVIDKIDPLLATAKDIADRIARGEGTIGRLAQDPEFPEDAKELGKILKRQPWKIIGHPPD